MMKIKSDERSPADLDRPILDIAARFWEKERYEAFKICYGAMRWADDIVDQEKALSVPLPDSKIAHIERELRRWLENLLEEQKSHLSRNNLAEVIKEYHLPFKPWEEFLKSMLYDLRHDGYRSLLTFLRYCRGAAVAPAVIFMHLCGVTREKGQFRPPLFDIEQAARPLALFSYFVHIIRDFQKDHLNRLNYFPERILQLHDLSREDLRLIAEGAPATPAFRRLVANYVTLAEYHRRKAVVALRDVIPSLHREYQFSLEVIYQLYLQIFEKINPREGEFTSAALNPTPEEIKSRLGIIMKSYFPETGPEPA